MLRSAMPWFVAGLLVLLVSGVVVIGGQMGPSTAQPTPITTVATRSAEMLTNAELLESVGDPDRFASAPAEITGRVVGTQAKSSTGAGIFLLAPDPPSGVMAAVEPPIGRAPAEPGTKVRVHGVFTHVETTELGGGSEARMPYIVANGIEVLAFDGTPVAEQTVVTTPMAEGAPVGVATPTPLAMPPDWPTTPGPVGIPTEASTVGPSESPVISPTPEPSAAPEASPSPSGSATPAVTATPNVTASPTRGATRTATAAPTARSSPTGAPIGPTPAPTASSPVVQLQPSDGGKVEARFAAADMARDAAFAVADPAAGGEAGVVSGETNPSWNGRGPAPNGGEARMTVEVPEGGEYAIWLRMRYSGLEANSVWLRVDDGQVYKVGNDSDGYGVWKWVGWSDGDTSKRVVVRLDSGQHTITLASREAGTEIDSVLVTSDTKTQP